MIVGISGKIGTGKSELAGMIRDRLGGEPGCIVASFGAMLKEEVSQKFNIPYDALLTRSGKDAVYFHPDLPSQSMTGRMILQWYGTDIVRRLDAGRWVRKLRECLDDWVGDHPDGHVGIDDVRFVDEAEMVVGTGGFLVRLDPWPGWTESEWADHESETALDDYDGFHMRPKRKLNDLPALAVAVVDEMRVWGEIARMDALLDP